MARVKTAAPQPPRPLWQRLLFSKWGLYLGVLPAGAALIVVLALVVFRDDGPRSASDADFSRDRIELALRDAALHPAFEGIPASATETNAGFAFFNGLRKSDNPLFAPWRSYAKIRDWIGTAAWVEVDGSYAGVGIYPSQDLEKAAAAFAALRDASGEDLLFLLAPQEGVERPDVVAGFERLPDPGLGDESLSYDITVQTLPFAGALGRTVKTTVIWSRVGATILFSARSIDVQTVGPADVIPDPIDIQALAQQLAARIAAFDPAAVPPGPYQFPQPEAATASDLDGGAGAGSESTTP